MCRARQMLFSYQKKNKENKANDRVSLFFVIVLADLLSAWPYQRSVVGIEIKQSKAAAKLVVRVGRCFVVSRHPKRENKMISLFSKTFQICFNDLRMSVIDRECKSTDF